MAGTEQAPLQTLKENENKSKVTAANLPEKINLGLGKATEQDVVEGKANEDRAAEGREARDEAFLVNFGPDDPEDPKNWSLKMKWGVTSALSATGFNRIMVSTVSLI